MIVKDEAKDIVRCLESVIPYIHTYQIVDTGSTDNTCQLMYDTMQAAGIRGMISHSKFKDFSTERNKALLLAKHSKTSHILFMDASDVLHATGPFEDVDIADAYLIKHTMGRQVWHRPALVRASLPWYWKGKIHETLMCRGIYTFATLEGAEIKCNVGGVFQGRERFLRDAALLENETDPRSTFYRAQSWQCAGELERAEVDYRRRMTMWHGDNQEIYVSCIQLHLLTGDIYPLTVAHGLDPLRAEAPFYLALCSLKEGRTLNAKVLLAEVVQVHMPDRALFADRDIYEWRALGCWALLTHDREAARKVINTPGAEYPTEMIELANGGDVYRI